MNTTLKTLLTAGIVLAAVVFAPLEASAKGPSERGRDEVRDKGPSRTSDRGHTPATRTQTPPTRSHTPSPRVQSPPARSHTPSPRVQSPPARSHTPSPPVHTSSRDDDRSTYSTGVPGTQYLILN